jgi:TP901 family phage tail tape measure protein
VTNRTVAVDLVARVQGYLAGIKTSIMATREFNSELDQMRRKNAAGYQDVTNSLLKVGAALTFISGWAIKTALEFDKAMSEVQAITGATADEMGRLRQAALDAGSSTVFSATEVAKAEADLAKAGLTTSQILGGALTGSLALAAAGSIDLSEAATVAANTMNQFALSGKDVGHIADLLAGAANATTADVHDLALALQMGGGAAHAAGMSLEDTLTALGALSKAALNGSDAGTSLKTMLLQLEGPSVKAAGIMEEYGFSVYDASGKMVDLYEMANRLQKSFGGLTQQQRNAAFANIFGNDAMRAANALYIQGATGLREVNKQLNAQADAAKVAATKTDNLAGDLNKLKGKLDSLMIGGSTGANSGLRILIQALDHLVGSFEKLPGPVQSGIVILAGVSGVALLAAAAFLKVRKAAADTVDAMRTAGTVSDATAGRLSRMTSVLGKTAAAFAALELAGTALSAAFGRNIQPNIDTLTASLEDFNRTGKATGAAVDILGTDLGHLDFALSTLGSGGMRKAETGAAKFMESLPGIGAVGSIADDSVQHATERLGALDQALTQMVQSGHGDDAGKIFATVWTEAQKMGVGLQDLQNGFPQFIAAWAQYQAGVGAAGNALEGTGAAAMSEAAIAEKTMERNRQLAGAFGAAASAAGGLKEAFDRLNGGFIAWEEASANVEQALVDLKKSFHDNGTTLDASTAKGRANIGALADYARATRDAMQAKMDETGSVQEADKVYEKYRQRLLKVLATFGIVGKAAQELVDKWLGMPSDKTITIHVNIKYKTTGAGTAGSLIDAMDPMHHADGAVVDYFANGGENHVAQIAPAGQVRVWNEPETEGEAYIPLAASKRGRSMAILSDVARRFNMAALPQGTSQSIAAAIATMGRGGPAPADFARAVRAGLQGMVVVLDGRAVGRVQGLQADSLGRAF